MNTKLLATAAVLMALAGQARALNTNTWNLETNADYYIAPADQPLIAVTQGVARLLLLSDQIHRSTFAEYVTNGSSRVSTRLGPDVSVSLKQSGSTYLSPGTFISRVLDSGAPANTWKKLYAKASYGTVLNSPIEILTDDSGLVALYHFNNSWIESVSGVNATVVGSGLFASEAVFGNKSAKFDANYYAISPNSTLLHGSGACTFSFWIKLLKERSYAGIFYTGGAVDYSGIATSIDGMQVVFYLATSGGSPRLYSLRRLPLNEWCFVTYTWDGNSGLAKFYVNGAEDNSLTGAYGTYVQKTPFLIAQDLDAPGRTLNALLDEVAIYNRALSSEEILNLFSRATSFFFQLRGGNTMGAVTNDANVFTGPDGTTNSYYYGENTILQTAGSFDVTNRFVQYKAYLLKDTSGNSPWIDAVALFGDYGLDYDYSCLDFLQGNFVSNTTNYPSVIDTPYLGLAKKENGGYYTNGTYLSRIMDAGYSGASWSMFEWEAPGELANDIPGMIALYHLNGSPSDSATLVGGDNTPSIYPDTWSEAAKLGTKCIQFDGVSAHMTGFPSLSTNIWSVEFWINDNNAQDGIMTFGGPACLAISNGFVIARGFQNCVPQVYVNGVTGSRKLMAGWNHVALTMNVALTGANLDVGVVNGDYMQGLLDEMAIYTRQLSSAEVKAHYLLGRQNVGGLARFNASASDSRNDLTGTGVVWGTDITASGTELANKGQYFRYILTMNGDGSAAPVAKNITITYLDSSSNKQYMCDNERASVYQGEATFVDGTTKWCGDEVMLIDQSQWGPANLLVNSEVGLVAEWRLDDENWGIDPVRDSKSGNNGTAYGAQTVIDAKVGLRSGVFSGIGQYLSLVQLSVGAGDFTLGAWEKSTSTNRSAILSTFLTNSSPHYTLEFNGDGVTNVPGKAAFVVSDAVNGTKVALSVMSDLNDGRWHHIAGVRSGDTIHLYVDGDRVASTFLGASYGSVVSPGIAYVARYGSITNVCFKGQVDEVVVYSRALSDAEVGELSGTAYKTRDRATYVSEIIDVGRPAIWKTMAWNAEAPYSKPLSAEDIDGPVALWHMDSNTLDSVGLYNGTLLGGAGYSSAGRFNACLSLSGSGQYVGSIADDGGLGGTNLTVEAWVYPTAVDSRIIFDKSNGAQGYQLGTDPSGRPYFTVGSVTGFDPCLSLRKNKWSHVAGTYNGKELVLYVDGEVRAKASVSVSGMGVWDAQIGGTGGGGWFAGLIDEAAAHDRVLQPAEILDHYRSGAVTLKFQARSGLSSNSITSASFVGPDSTTNTFFTLSSGVDLQTAVPLGQCFQFKAYLATENHRFTPRLQGVRVDASSYSTNCPAVDSINYVYFPGMLTMFSQTMGTNAPSSVRYQVSGDGGAKWHFWGGSNWVDEADWAGFLSPWDCASDIWTMNANIGSFYRQLYAKTGINARWRAFLHSGGADQVALDSVTIVSAPGRIVVTSPNGTEVGTKAWIVGTPYDITWTSAGVVGTNLVIELLDGSNVVSTLASGVPNSGLYRTVISEQGGTNYYIRVHVANDMTMTDDSDGPFWLVEQFHLTSPDGGEKWFIGRTNTVVWDSPKWGAQNLEGAVDLWFSDDAGTSWFVFSSPTNVSGHNTFVWNTPSNDARFVSESAKMGIAAKDALNPVDAKYCDVSDNTFTNAGIVITFPRAGDAVNMGEPNTIAWRAAGAGTGGASVDFFNGAVWTNIASNAVCLAGSNSFSCSLTAPNPSEDARIKVTANDDPTRVFGLSDKFILANINILFPTGGTKAVRSQWQIGTTQRVVWTAAGAGDAVNIMFSPDGGGTWSSYASSWPNTNSTAGGIVTNYSPPFVVSGPPSSNALIKIQSVSKPTLLSVTPPYFDISGVQVVYPNGGEYWAFGMTNEARWLYESAGANVGIDVAYVSSPTTNDYENVASAGIFSGRAIIQASSVRRPSTVAKLRLRSLSIPSMIDYSDDTFVIRGLSETGPTNGSVYTLGNTYTNGLQWYSAGAGGNTAKIYYSTNGVNYDDVVMFGSQDFTANTDADPSLNQKDWLVSRRLMPSATARVKVVVNTYEAVSPQFVLRGIRITRPIQGSVVDIGTAYGISWRSAGLILSAFASNSISTTGEGGPYTDGGLPGSAFVLNNGAPWTPASELDPSTNAVIRMTVTTPAQDTDVIAYSDPFVLRGLKVVSPNVGTNWSLGGQGTVTFLSAGMGGGAFANVYYSSNGIDFDLTHPIAQNVAVSDGLNVVPWNIENSPALTRMPSTNAGVMVVCGSYSGKSKPFRMSGIKIITPKSTDIWAVTDLTNTIRWVGVDTAATFDLDYMVWDSPIDWGNPKAGGAIDSGVPGWSLDWTMTPAALGSNVAIRITDGNYVSTSEVFQIILTPGVKIVSPGQGEFWKVTETNVVKWIKAGDMSNAFRLAWSPAPFVVTNVLKSGFFDLVDGMYSYTWANIPNSPGKVRILVVNTVDGSIADEFEDFEIAAKFRFEPFVGTLFALQTRDVYWTTFGSLFQGVDLYYSVDPLRRTNNWHLVNTEGPFMTVPNGDITKYSWNLPNVKTNTVWLRVQDHAYGNRVFDTAKPGPYDDLGMLNIRYFGIYWEVFDKITTNRLDKLAVIDSSGWSASDLSCMSGTIYHEYPFGTWNTAWYREFYFDEVLVSWKSDNALLGSPAVWTQQVYLSRSQIEPDYHVLANFSYETSNKTFTIHSWLERGGAILTTPAECKITIYDADGNQIHVIDNTKVQSTGVFWMNWDASSLAPSAVYFAKVDILFSDNWYSSGLTFTLRVPLGDEIAGMIGGISNQVYAVYTSLVDHAAAEAAFRGRTDTNLNAISSTLSSLTNLPELVGIIDNLASNVSKVASMTNLAALVDNVSNIWNTVTNIGDITAQLLPRITFRATTVKSGSTNVVTYMSKVGLGQGPQIKVQDFAGNTKYTANMSEIPSSGIYKSEVIFNPAWGLGDFTVTCRDSGAASAPGDQIVLQVVSEGYWTDSGTWSSLTGRLARVEVTVSNLWRTLGTADFATTFSNMFASVSNLETTVRSSNLTNAETMAALLDLTNLTSSLTNIDMTSIRTGITNVQASVASLDAQVAGLAGMASAIDALGTQVGASSTAAEEAAKNARSAKTQVLTIQGSVASLKTALGEGNKETAMTMLSSIRDQLNGVRNEVAKRGSMQPVVDVLTGMAGDINALAMRKNLDALVTIPDEMRAQTQITGKGIARVNDKVAEMKATIDALHLLVDQVANPPQVITYWTTE